MAWPRLPLWPRAIDLVALLHGGGITICTPPDTPIIRTTIQLDGDLINYIDPDALTDALTRGADPTAIVLQHQQAMAARVAPLADTTAWLTGLPWSVVGLIFAGLWGGVGLLRDFDPARHWPWLAVTLPAAAVLRLVPRWIVTRMLRSALRRFRAPPA